MSEEEIAYIKSKSGLRGGALRKLGEEGDEDYEYWRKRAGWFDDDVSMQEYNSGVYNTYYDADDTIYSGSGGGSVGGGSGIEWVKILLNTALVSIALALAFLLYKTITGRRSSSSKETKETSTERKKSSRGRSDSSTRRSRSKSTSSRRSSRSKSRSRKTDDSYKLMDDEDDKSRRSSRSVKSSRSRSRSIRRSRSRGSTRSKSRTRSKSKKRDESRTREIKEVLV